MFSVFVVKDDFIKKNPDLLKDIVKASVQSNRHFYDDPAWFMDHAPKVLPSLDAEALPKTVELYQKFKVYPINGGLTPAAQRFTIDFMVDSGQLEKGITPEQAFDRSILDKVLAEIGTR